MNQDTFNLAASLRISLQNQSVNYLMSSDTLNEKCELALRTHWQPPISVVQAETALRFALESLNVVSHDEALKIPKNLMNFWAGAAQETEEPQYEFFDTGQQGAQQMLQLQKVDDHPHPLESDQAAFDLSMEDIRKGDTAAIEMLAMALDRSSSANQPEESDSLTISVTFQFEGADVASIRRRAMQQAMTEQQLGTREGDSDPEPYLAITALHHWADNGEGQITECFEV